MVSPAEFSWKDEVQGKLLNLFENDPETLCRILSYLDEDADTSPDDGTDISYAWRTLYSVVDSDEEFKEYVNILIVGHAEDNEFSENMDPPSAQVKEASRNTNDDFYWKDDIWDKLLSMFKDDSQALASIFQNLHDEDEKYDENGAAGIPPVWEILKASYHSDELFKECVMHLVEQMKIAENDKELQDTLSLSATQMESLCDLDDIASTNDCYWKDDVRRKLKVAFENDDESLTSILLYLNEGDQKHKCNDSTTITPAWNILRSALYSDKVFQEYAKRIAEDTKKADKDKSFSESMDFMYNQMMESLWCPEGMVLPNDCSWKEDIRNKLIEMFEHDAELLDNISVQLEEEDKACIDNSIVGSFSVWEILRAAFYPVYINQEYAEHYLEMTEPLWNPENDFTWKDDIRHKLITVLGTDTADLARILDYLEEEDEIVRDEENACIQPVWNMLNSALHSDKKFQEHVACLVEDTRQAENNVEFRKTMKMRYTKMFEDIWKSNHTALADGNSWKDDIRSKLIEIFEKDTDSVALILFYLDEEDKAYKESDGIDPPVWTLLKFALYSNKVFRGYAERLADDVKKADEDAAYRDTMNIIYSQMLEPFEEPASENHAQGFAVPSVSVTDLVPRPSGNLLRNCVKNPHAIAILDKAFGIVTKPIFMAGAAAVYLGIKAISSVRKWWQGKISGRRCAKQIIDSTASLAAAFAGGMGGAALGGLIGGPLGGMLGSMCGTLLASSVMDCLCGRLTQWLFGIPRDKALENAYNYLGVHMTASNNEINKTYHKLCLQHHPDKSGGNSDDFLLLQIHIAVIRKAREGR